MQQPTHIKAVQKLVYNNFIKHEVLRKLTMEAFAYSSANELNIYIDMYRMMLDLYSPNVEFEDTTIITSTMINLCAHMRDYYRRHHSVETKIFLVYSDMSNMYNRTLYPEYNSSNYFKSATDARVSEIIDFNISLLETLCPYLPDIYFVKGTWEPSVIIKDLIDKEEAFFNNSNPNLILSRDEMSIQIPSIRQNTVCYFDSKRTGESFYADYNNAIVAYLRKTNRLGSVSNPNTLQKISHINPSLLGLLMTLSNVPCRSVKTLYDINKSINIIELAIRKLTLYNGPAIDPDTVYNSLFVGKESKIDSNSFAFRFRAVNLLSMCNEYINTPYAKDMNYRVDLIDDDTVRSIDMEYFHNNPLDLNRL